MACERPAIVQCPLNLAIVMSEPIEQHGDVEIIAMEIMEMDDIGIYPIKIRKQALCSLLRMETRSTIKPCLQNIDLDPDIGGKLALMVVLSIAATTPKYIGVITRRQKLTMLAHHDATRRAIRYGIDMRVNRHARLPRKTYPGSPGQTPRSPR